MSGFGRPPPLLAARQTSGEPSRSNSDSNGNGNPDTPQHHRSKRTLIESACSACRRRKSRCDGARPSCTRCATLRTECNYETEEGESRWSALRRRNQILETERTEVRELMSYIQSLNEPEAQEIFQRIRGGGYDDVFNILRQLREGDLPSPGNQSHNPNDEHRLPPIRTMFDVSGVSQRPYIATAPPVPQFLQANSNSNSNSSGSQSTGSQSNGWQSRGSQSGTDLPVTTAPN